MASSSTRANAPLPHAPAPSLHARWLRRTYWLLALVGAMAVATALALGWTVYQAQSLAQPYLHSETWHVSSVHNELARVSLLARQVQAGEAPAQELQDRVDVLFSTLDTSGRVPRVNQRLREVMPQPAAQLDTILHHARQWSERLQPAGVDARPVAADIVAASDALLEGSRRAVAAVHLFSTQQADHARRQLYSCFMLLSAVLVCLLAGTALLLWRLVRDTRLASAASQQLAEANRQLELRVASRTRKIEEGRALLGFILDSSPSDVVLAEVESGRVHFINHRLTERLGLAAPPRTLFLQHLLHDPETRERFMQALDTYGQVDAMEALIGDHTPSWSTLSARLIEVDGQLAHLLWGFDISAHKALEAQLRELATRDALSGLLNRRAFMERGAALFDHCRRHGQPCTVLMIDIDHFKQINDRHGHQRGDEALRACAGAIGQVLRDADVLGRLGGEEFAALLPHSSAQSALAIAERIRSAVALVDLPAQDGAAPITFTVSIGVAEMLPGHAGLDPLLAEADLALYHAKASGRNKVLAYEPTIRQP